MLTIGYGDIVPTTDNEKIFVIFTLIVACATFAYIVGSIESIFERQDVIIADFK